MLYRNYLIILFICFHFAEFYSQTAVQFPEQDFSNESFISTIARNNNGQILLFWFNNSNSKLFMSRSSDEGQNWTPAQNILDNYSFFPDTVTELNSFVNNSSKIFLQFKIKSTRSFNYYSISTDNGYSWSSPQWIKFASNFLYYSRGFYTSLGKLSNNLLVFAHSYLSANSTSPKGIYFSKYQDTTWTTHQLIDSTGVWGFIFSPSANKEMVVFADYNGNKTDLYFRTSTDLGVSWSAKQILISTPYSKSRPRAIKSGNEIYIYYEEKTSTFFSNIYQKEIFYIKSTDFGQSWLSPTRVTRYAGNDSYLNICESIPQPILTFISDRNSEINRQYSQVYLLKGIELQSPPVLFNAFAYEDTVPAFSNYFVRALVDDIGFIDSVKLIFQGLNKLDTVLMYDDGLHQDSLAGDRIFGASVSIADETLNLHVKILNSMGLANTPYLGFITTPHLNETKYLINLNRISLPVNDFGFLSDVDIDGNSVGKLDGKTFLFGSGFTMVGKSQNQWWANGVFSPSRIADYKRGISGTQGDPRYRLYVVTSSDPAFGDSWQNWRNAVAIGADFYDGNSDGIYNPVDLNGNGKWDIDEDKPDLIGDITVWCIYNDGVPAQYRIYGVDPIGINIKQTIFGVKPASSHQADNMFFVRYRISQNGSVAQEFDSVYFMIRTDPDIGIENNANMDDLAGCDTLLNSGYAYNEGDDPEWGVDPPAAAFTLLQGPVVYIPGVTFIDTNSNGIYDPGIDTPLDTAYVRKGPLLGDTIYPGAKNQTINSFRHYIPCGHPLLGEPNIVSEVVNSAKGLDKLGNTIDPCTLEFGQVLGGVPCNLVNPLFMYSGDPLNNIGWINTSATDQRTSTTVGPFKLIANEEVDIWVGYILGRGSSALNSISIMKDNIQFAINSYSNNFKDLPVSVETNDKIILRSFVLYQNYPNPFNPYTTIRYELPQDGVVTIELFDILGQKVKTILNEFKRADRYEVTFSSAGLASGVYIYQLRVNEFITSKKMMLLK